MTGHTDSKGNELSSDESSHLREYLEHYKTLSKPGYGVLVTGDWGSGKTHQVTEILAKDEIYYISLFGAQTTEEIYSAVYAKMHPGMYFTKEIAKSANGAGAGPINVGGLLSGVANALIREQVNNDKIIVFDDLERSRINTNDLLGVFNKYIEHHNCRVIVLAHDKKITDTFKGTKEKVFGQTIAITPQTSKAFDSFTSEIKDHSILDLVNKHKSAILETFSQSETYSLRILKHSIDDFARLLGTLSSTHKSNEAAILEITRLFFALSLEVRAGRLDESCLKDRSDKIIRYQMKMARKEQPAEIPEIYNSFIRYKNIDIGNRILSDGVLINTLFKGSYSEVEIHASLNESLYFTSPADLPAWLVFMKFDELNDKESNDAAEKLKNQFAAREIVEPGEILHLFSLRFLLSDMELISSDFSQTEADCKQYMEDLLNLDKVKSHTGYQQMWGDNSINSYGGYGYWVEESYKDHFSRVVNHFKDIQTQAVKKRYPEFAKTLLSLVSSDGNQFAEKISHTNSGQNDFAAIDVLASIPPSDFVQEWMGSPATNWRHISRGLEQRYSTGKLSTSLKSEKPWLKEVINLIEREKIKSRGIRQKRIERVLQMSLRNLA
ncbi:hypothetical protein [Pseudomonas sp. Irchel s3b2]|uniref:hypothetical protein n=1 Tax=Pseudomonas sp. Irchel s3b2 TaxID=2009073 RepID=UPI0011401B06|nr:hypothetical protein [Pseudomonas sp. Irchel s3b2]